MDSPDEQIPGVGSQHIEDSVDRFGKVVHSRPSSTGRPESLASMIAATYLSRTMLRSVSIIRIV